MHEATKFTESAVFEKVVSSMDRIRGRFFQSQVENIERRSQGRRYSLEDKALALAFLNNVAVATNFYQESLRYLLGEL